MKQLALERSPEYYRQYIQLVDDQPILNLLQKGGIEHYQTAIAELKALDDMVYEEGKWTAKEMIQHLIDTERIFMNRALRFVRNDSTNLPGYDHNAYVPASRVEHLTIDRLLEEYETLRKSSFYFYEALNQEELLRSGVANGVEISVLSIGFVLVGHPIHHFNVLKERYFPLI